jgi:hypothetical protein
MPKAKTGKWQLLLSLLKKSKLSCICRKPTLRRFKNQDWFATDNR